MVTYPERVQAVLNKDSSVEDAMRTHTGRVQTVPCDGGLTWGRCRISSVRTHLERVL